MGSAAVLQEKGAMEVADSVAPSKRKQGSRLWSQVLKGSVYKMCWLVVSTVSFNGWRYP